MRLILPFLVLLPSAAMADDYVSFHSPSKNIQCGIYVGDDYKNARCDVMEMTARSYTKAPADCELEWGNSFAVDDTGKGYLACVGDAIIDEAGLTLGYGSEINLGGFTCRSEQSGITCVNEGGHGFMVSKAKQRLF